nr:alpha-E domain-containing protein [uncultured Cohaesibacter sp.]
MTMLLSRYAEALFWFARYVERSASLARILNVQAGFWQDDANQENWSAIVSLYADTDRFEEKYDTINARNVASFYITDRENPGSIMSCLWAARENARLLRPLISVSMWSYINMSFNEFSKLSNWDLHPNRLARTCEVIARRCDAIMGVTESTYYRDAGWRFYQLGLWIERADQTSRLLDVKVAQIGSSHWLDDGEDSVTDAEFWKLLLHSFEAYHAFQRTESGILDPKKVANFLMFNESFPRSLTHCIGELQGMLKDLYLGYKLYHVEYSYEEVENLLRELESAANDPHLHLRFHGFNDKVQHRLMGITQSLGTSFFGHAAAPVEDASTQSQSQS